MCALMAKTRRNGILPSTEGSAGLGRRELLRLGTLVTAFTGASAVSALGANSAAAAPGDKVQPSTYVTIAEKGAASGVATLGSDSKIPLVQLPDMSATFVRKSDLMLNVRDYGARGDGVSDDTAALKAWLAAGGVALTDGSFRITSGLTLLGDNRQLLMHNAKIIADEHNITALTVTGNNARVSVYIDGNHKANYGIKITGAGAIIESSVIENIFSSTTTARGIEATTGGGCVIRNNVIRNIRAVGDSILGNNNGAARAIILISTAAATKESVIGGNFINNVVGEEGDAIQILFYEGSSTINPSADVTIADNEIFNVSRRFIKIQASNARIINNTLGHDGSLPVYPGNSIDIIRSDTVTVSDNRISPNPLGVAINVVGAEGTRAKDSVIKNNLIRQDNAKNYISIFMNYLSEAVVRDNTIFGGGSAVAIGNSTSLLVQGNVHHGGIGSCTSFTANATNTGVVMRLNVNMNSTRTICVSNSGSGALTELNATRT